MKICSDNSLPSFDSWYIQEKQESNPVQVKAMFGGVKYKAQNKAEKTAKWGKKTHLRLTSLTEWTQWRGKVRRRRGRGRRGVGVGILGRGRNYVKKSENISLVSDMSESPHHRMLWMWRLIHHHHHPLLHHKHPIITAAEPLHLLQTAATPTVPTTIAADAPPLGCRLPSFFAAELPQKWIGTRHFGFSLNLCLVSHSHYRKNGAALSLSLLKQWM